MLKDISKDFNDVKVAKLIDGTTKMTDQVTTQVDLLFILGLIYIAIAIIVTIYYLKVLKK